MKAITYLYLGIFCILCCLSNTTSAQCPDDNTNSGVTVSVAPSTVAINSGEYFTLQVTANTRYTVTTCNSAGLIFDPMLAVYADNPAPGTLITDNDDFCGPYSEVIWISTFTGTVRVLLDEFDFINGPCFAGGVPLGLEIFTDPVAVWTGAMSTDWATTGNWSSNSVPGIDDIVVIPATSNDPILAGDQGKIACMIIETGATLTVAASGKINVYFPFNDGILVDGGNLINHGNIIIQEAFFDGLDLESAGTCTNHGSISITYPGDDGIDIDDEPFIGASMMNHGTIYISNAYFTGIDIEEDATMTNSATGIIQISGTEDESLHLDGDGSQFDNMGQITITDGYSEGLEVDENTTFTNHTDGRILIVNCGVYAGEDDAIDNDGDLINDGNIIVDGSGTSDIGIKTDTYFENNGQVFVRNVQNEPIYNEGTFENNLLLELGTQGASGGGSPIAGLANEGTFNNANCGVVNLVTANFIANLNPFTLTNDGRIATTFTGNNINDGTFTNNGEISEPNGVFPVTGTALVGAGTISSGPIPITEAAGGCPSINPAAGVPTLSEWGLILLALAMLALATLALTAPTVSSTTGMSWRLIVAPVNKRSLLKWAVGAYATLGIVFLVAIVGLGYELTGADVCCAPIAGLLLGYIGVLIWEK